MLAIEVAGLVLNFVEAFTLNNIILVTLIIGALYIYFFLIILSLYLNIKIETSKGNTEIDWTTNRPRFVGL
jgi:hypothetical protein